MLERMMIDISKWLVIILIFFVAFACSLFLIFSYFAISAKQRHLLANPSPSLPADVTLSPYRNTSDGVNYGHCPDMFYTMTNRTIPDRSREQGNKNDENKDGFCAKIDHKDQLKVIRVGPSPAVYYFGRSFGATTLTTFFTLFGVIAEDKIAVGEY
jgi:ABC-type glycerol-3-phosphate transport system permease component